MELKAEYKQLGVTTGRVTCDTNVDKKGQKLFDSLGDKSKKKEVTTIEEMLRQTSLEST